LWVIESLLLVKVNLYYSKQHNLHGTHLYYPVRNLRVSLISCCAKFSLLDFKGLMSTVCLLSMYRNLGSDIEVYCFYQRRFTVPIIRVNRLKQLNSLNFDVIFSFINYSAPPQQGALMPVLWHQNHFYLSIIYETV
jgi:hypothetical protein